MASVKQGGSILNFLLIGGVLVALLIGGAYVVQQRSTRSVATPATTRSDGAPEKAATPDNKVAVEPNKDAAKQEEAKKAEQQKATAKQEAEKKEAAKKEAAKSPAPAATELPKTGPAENLSAILGLGLLSGVTVAYVRSRSHIATL